MSTITINYKNQEGQTITVTLPPGCTEISFTETPASKPEKRPLSEPEIEFDDAIFEGLANPEPQTLDTPAFAIGCIEPTLKAVDVVCRPPSCHTETPKPKRRRVGGILAELLDCVEDGAAIVDKGRRKAARKSRKRSKRIIRKERKVC